MEEDFEEFAVKLRAYLCMKDARYESVFKAIADDPDRAITDADCIASAGQAKPALANRQGNFNGSW